MPLSLQKYKFPKNCLTFFSCDLTKKFGLSKIAISHAVLSLSATYCTDQPTNAQKKMKKLKRFVFLFVLKESAPGDIQSPLTPESINGTDDERATPDLTQNSELRAEPTQNALSFTHR